MTAQERVIATEKLRELEQSGRFSEETIRDLKAWWQSVLHRERNKVVSIDEWQKRYVS